MSTINKYLFTAALNLLLIAGGSAYSGSAAALPITWTLQNVTFADGGTASGEFTLNPYGFLDSSSITTTTPTPATAGSFTGNVYTYPGNSINPVLDASSLNTVQITFQIDYLHALNLVFQYTVDSGNPQINPLILALSSFECEGSSSCATGNIVNIANDGGKIRYVSSGAVVTGLAAIPEPSALGLLMMGAAGAYTRMRSKKHTQHNIPL